MFDDVKERFSQLEDGRYVCKIKSFQREKQKNGKNPLRWNIELVAETEGKLPYKYSDIETDSGFRIFLEELRRLGISRPRNAEDLEKGLKELEGAFVEIGLYSDELEMNKREMRILRRLPWLERNNKT